MMGNKLLVRSFWSNVQSQFWRVLFVAADNILSIVSNCVSLLLGMPFIDLWQEKNSNMKNNATSTTIFTASVWDIHVLEKRLNWCRVCYLLAIKEIKMTVKLFFLSIEPVLCYFAIRLLKIWNTFNFYRNKLFVTLYWLWLSYHWWTTCCVWRAFSTCSPQTWPAILIYRLSSRLCNHCPSPISDVHCFWIITSNPAVINQTGTSDWIYVARGCERLRVIGIIRFLKLIL